VAPAVTAVQAALELRLAARVVLVERAAWASMLLQPTRDQVRRVATEAVAVLVATAVLVALHPWPKVAAARVA
jgi:hypothetical protein